MSNDKDSKPSPTFNEVLDAFRHSVGLTLQTMARHIVANYQRLLAQQAQQTERDQQPEKPETLLLQLPAPVKPLTKPANAAPSAAELALRKRSLDLFTPEQRKAVLKEFLLTHEGGRDALWTAYQKEIYERGRGPWLSRQKFERDYKKQKSPVSSKKKSG